MRKIREAPKRAVNLLLNAGVLDMAREMGMNISHVVDGLLTAEVLRREQERWQHDNAAAIADYNRRIERDGTFAQRISRHLAQADATSDSLP